MGNVRSAFSPALILCLRGCLLGYAGGGELWDFRVMLFCLLSGLVLGENFVGFRWDAEFEAGDPNRVSSMSFRSSDSRLMRSSWLSWSCLSA